MVAPNPRWGLALPLSHSLKPREWEGIRESWQGVLPLWVPWAEQETALSAPTHSSILRRRRLGALGVRQPLAPLGQQHNEPEGRSRAGRGFTGGGDSAGQRGRGEDLPPGPQDGQGQGPSCLQRRRGPGDPPVVASALGKHIRLPSVRGSGPAGVGSGGLSGVAPAPCSALYSQLRRPWSRSPRLRKVVRLPSRRGVCREPWHRWLRHRAGLS